MRILHTADWHLGRTLEGRSRLDEQAQLVDELCQLVDAESVQLVIIAGDVYDTANPPAGAEELFYDAISRLSAGGRRAVLAIAGNHDNPERLCAASPLATRQSVVLLGHPGDTPALNSVNSLLTNAGPGWCEFTFAGERAVVAVLPYPSEARLNEAFVSSITDEAAMRQAYSDRVARAFQSGAMHFCPDTIRLAISHLYTAGGNESDSERPIQVGGAFTVHPGAFPVEAQYVALGHLHRPQNVGVAGAPAIRYSGSPLAYSFSEAGQAKSVTLIDATPTQLTWQEVHLSAGRPLVRWRAPYGLSQVEQWCNDGRDANAWVELEIQLDTPLTPDEVARLKRLHQGLVVIRPVFNQSAEVAATAEDRQGMPVQELFRLFYMARRDGAEPDSETIQLFLELLEKAAHGQGSAAEGSL